MERIRVLEVLASASVGGGATHLRDLVLGMDSDRFEVHVACGGEGPLVAQLLQSGVQVHALSFKSRTNVRTMIPLVGLIQQHRIDLVHFHGTRAGLCGALAGGLMGRPRLYTAHGWSFHPRGNRHLEAMARQIERVICTMSDRVICVSEADRLAALAYKVVSADKSRVIPNGVEPERFQVSTHLREATRTALGVLPREYLVSLFGRLTYQKGQRILLEAAVPLLRELPRARFLLVGDGEDRSYLEQRARELGVAERIGFMGARDDIPELLAASDLVVLPSHWEGLPICLLEAMAGGKPIVATRVDGTPEVVVHGKTGILIPPGNACALARAILYMEQHPYLATHYGEMGRIRLYERFLVSGMVRETALLYQELYQMSQRASVLARGLR